MTRMPLPLWQAGPRPRWEAEEHALQGLDVKGKRWSSPFFILKEA